jgi:hypothetical protein
VTGVVNFSMIEVVKFSVDEHSKLVVKFGELPSQAATANAANNRTPHPTTSATPPGPGASGKVGAVIRADVASSIGEANAGS